MGDKIAVERRREAREPMSSSDQSVELLLPYPPNTSLLRPLLDRTKKGFAFKMSLREGTFLPNTPLRITRLGPKESELSEMFGQVRYAMCAPEVSDEPYQRVGVELLPGYQHQVWAENERFVFEKTIYLTDTNALGNAYFARYFDWQGMAREEFLRRLLPDPVAFFGAGMKIFTVKAETEYKSGLALYDELQIEIRTMNIKKTSFDFVFFLRRKLDGQLAALGRQRFCVIDASGEFTIIPPTMKENLLKYRMPKVV